MNETIIRFKVMLERDGEKFEISPAFRYSKKDGDYGNGYHLLIDGAGLGFMNIFDIRYDKRFSESDMKGFSIRMMREDLFTGENGSCRIIEILEK